MMPGDVLVQASPAIAALVGIAAVLVAVPRSRASLTRRDPPVVVVTPEARAAELVRLATAIRGVTGYGPVTVQPVGEGFVVRAGHAVVTCPSPEAARRYVASALRRAA